MKILVTGCHGQVAASIAERARRFEHLDIGVAGRPALELADAESIRRVIAAAKPDIVVNAAAFTDVDGAERDPDAALQVNGIAPGVLARAAAEVGSRMIHISTDYVFDGRQTEPRREDDPANPINVYGHTKLAGEMAVRSALPGHVILRTAWVYSPFGRNFVKTILRLAEQRDRIEVVEDQFGSPTSALDLADAILTIAERWRAAPEEGAGETFHIAGHLSTSWAGLARHVFAASGEAGGPVAEVIGIGSAQWPTPAQRPRYSLLDSSKFNRVFGYAAPAWTKSVGHVVRRLIADDSFASP